MDSSTRARVLSDTRPAPRRTLETVDFDTPDRAATSTIVGRCDAQRSGGMGRDDLPAQRDVPQAVRAGRAWLALLDDRGVELLELALERLLVGDDVLGAARRDAARLAVLDDQPRRVAAQQRRRELERRAVLRAVERPVLRVAGDAGKVDPGEHRLDAAERRVDRHAGVPDARVADVGLAEEAAHAVDLVDHAVEQDRLVGALEERVLGAEPLTQAPLVVLAQLREQ